MIQNLQQKKNKKTMTKFEAYEAALKYYASITETPTSDEVLKLADQILAWSIRPVKDENGNNYFRKVI